MAGLKRGATPTPRDVLAKMKQYRARGGGGGGGNQPGETFIIVRANLSAWGNDRYGDCVTAEEAFAKVCHTPEIDLTEDQVIAWAEAHGVLDAATLPYVMDVMQNDGFREGDTIYDDGPYAVVEYRDGATLRSAIFDGPVKVGVGANQLDAVHTHANGWFAIGFEPEGMGHCVTLCGYGSVEWLAQQLGVEVPDGVDGRQPGYAIFTWGSIGIIDAPSMVNITSEAFVRQPTTVMAHAARSTVAEAHAGG